MSKITNQLVALALMLSLPQAALAQTSAAPPGRAAAAPSSQHLLTDAELDPLLAPIASRRAEPTCDA